MKLPCFFIANGTAILRDSRLVGDSIDVSLKGRIDLVRTTLALRGMIKNKLTTAASNDHNDLQFFVGGTASSPLFVPLPMTKRATEVPKEPEKTSQDQ